MANSEDPVETAHYKPSQLDLHCLQRYLHWTAGMKGLTEKFLFQVSGPGNVSYKLSPPPATRSSSILQGKPPGTRRVSPGITRSSIPSYNGFVQVFHSKLTTKNPRTHLKYT